MQEVKCPRFLGTSHNGNYKYYLKNNGYVYQEDVLEREIGWYCTWSAWENGLDRCLDKIEKQNVEEN